MPAKIISLDGSDSCASAIADVAAAVRDGAIVIFPTETVYGVGASAANPAAIARIRALKEREDAQPFTVHLGQGSDAARFVDKSAPVARRLARRLWPGPLTLICEVADPSRAEVANSLPESSLREIYCDNRVGLRFPDQAHSAAMIAQSGVPFVASSANRRGNTPPNDMRQALLEMDGAVDFALDGGRTKHKKASTIVEIVGNSLQVMRTGALEERTIRRYSVSEVMFVCTGNSCRSPLAEYLFRRALASRLSIPEPQLAELGYIVSSVGTIAFGGGTISAGSREELARRGIDASRHRASPLTAERIDRAERIFAMTADHREAVIELVASAESKVALLDPGGAVADPVGGGPDQYRAAAAQIEALVNQRVEEFLNDDRRW